MVFIALLIAVFTVYLIQSKIYSERVFSQLTYHAYFDCEETVAGQDIFMYEEITNLSALPIPNAKVNTRLPDGLKFITTDKKSGKTVLTEGVQSVFVLRGHAVIRRKWRVRCEKRGVYCPLGCVMIINDLFGTGAVSGTLEFSDSEKQRHALLYVIPEIGEIPTADVENEFILGDKSVLLGMLEDPLENNGIREYRDGDPMNSFNWSATAAHDKLLVNRYEFTRERRYNIVLNLCSRDNERDAHIPSIFASTEESIKVCAALLDRAAATQPSVRLAVNTLADVEKARDIAEKSAYRTADKTTENAAIYRVKEEDTAPESRETDHEKEILVTSPFMGRQDLADALRLLAELPLYYTCTLEKMLESIADGERPELFDGSFIIITPYVNERILRFYDSMKKRGIKVVFYLSSSSQFDISQKETDADIIYA